MRTAAWVMFGFALGHFVTRALDEVARVLRARHRARASRMHHQVGRVALGAAKRAGICAYRFEPDGFCPLPMGHKGSHQLVVIPAPMGPVTDADEALVEKVRGWQEGRPDAS